jgi:hypothetical protein
MSSSLISPLQHRQIAQLLEEWQRLDKLHNDIQIPGFLSVQVQGSHREEFLPGALKAAKEVLNQKAQRIRADLKQLDYDVTSLFLTTLRSADDTKN